MPDTGLVLILGGLLPVAGEPVVIPLAMAFGIASKVTPQAGIYTAIVGGFLVSLLGGSRIQIGGPTGAFIPIVYGIVGGKDRDGGHAWWCHHPLLMKGAA
mgnify:CR=1 FL=1